MKSKWRGQELQAIKPEGNYVIVSPVQMYMGNTMV
jgi:hypothetical protein